MIPTFLKYYGLYQIIEVRWNTRILLFSPPRANQLGGPLSVVSNRFIHSLVFSLKGRVGRNQSPVM